MHGRGAETLSAMVALGRVTFVGHLTRQGVERGLGALPTGVRQGVLVDCQSMTGYDLDARHAFVAWHESQRAHIAGVAIVTSNAVWHMVIRAMSLASGVDMRAFETPAAAETWLATRS